MKHVINIFHVLTNGELSDIIIKYATAPAMHTMMGRVTNIQNGQQGPAMTMGDPSARSHKINILPNRRAQQQKNRL